MPSRADRIVTVGIAAELKHLQEGHMHKTRVGRVANNTLMQASVRAVEELAQRGEKIQVAQVLGKETTALRRVMAAMSDRCIIDLLDPTREESSDTLSVADLIWIESAWEQFTEPAPDYVVNHKIGDGEYVTKPVHWKKHSGSEIFDKAPLPFACPA